MNATRISTPRKPPKTEGAQEQAVKKAAEKNVAWILDLMHKTKPKNPATPDLQLSREDRQEAAESSSPEDPGAPGGTLPSSK
jgi:hypothetical protein